MGRPDNSLGARLARRPVIATLYGAEQMDALLASQAEVAIVANIELRRLRSVISTITGAGKIAIVNIDSCDGISPDKGGVDYLVDLGASSLLSTRVATIQRANKAGLLTMQKVFVTDRSTWPRSLKAIEQSDPNLVQIMPAPMLAHISEAEKQSMPPIVASGFVCGREHVQQALSSGAIAVSSSDAALWSSTPKG